MKQKKTNNSARKPHSHGGKSTKTRKSGKKTRYSRSSPQPKLSETKLRLLALGRYISDLNPNEPYIEELKELLGAIVKSCFCPDLDRLPGLMVHLSRKIVVSPEEAKLSEVLKSHLLPFMNAFASWNECSSTEDSEVMIRSVAMSSYRRGKLESLNNSEIKTLILDSLRSWRKLIRHRFPNVPERRKAVAQILKCSRIFVSSTIRSLLK